MCKNCERKIMAEFSLLMLANEPGPDGPTPLQVAALFMGAVAIGDVETLAEMSATLPIEVVFETVRQMMFLSDSLKTMSVDMVGAMGRRAMETGEALPDGAKIIGPDTDPATLTDDEKEALRRMGVDIRNMGETGPVALPPDDNPELLKAIFQNRPPKPGKGPVS